MKAGLWLCLLAAALPGCAQLREPVEWSAGTVVPKPYEAWVEILELETSGIRRWRLPQGHIRCCWREPHNLVSGGKTPPPTSFLVHWFSYAERKHYAGAVRLPGDLEERMRRKTPTRRPDGEIRYAPQNALVIGLAPGGQIVVWLMNQSQNAEEILRSQAREVGGETRFEVRLEQYETQHGDYLRRHGIQYEGW